MKRLLIAILFSAMLGADTVRLAVAANVGYAIEDVIEQFNKSNSDIKVQTTLGGTGKLVAQILHGAPYDILLAADMLYPEALHEDGMAAAEPKVYARGALILLSAAKRDLSAGLKVLRSKDIHKIAVANPKTAPYGRAAFEAMERVGVLHDIKSKFVYGESISQTVAFTLKAADIGIVSKSSIYSPQMSRYKGQGHWAEIDQSLYSPIDQGIVLLKRAQDNSSAKRLYDFILSNEAGVIFQKYGYTLP